MSRTCFDHTMTTALSAGSAHYTRVYITCPVCNGNLVVPCLLCGGNGQCRHDAMTCSGCTGTGWKRCHRCNGVGEILCRVHGDHTILDEYIPTHTPLSPYHSDCKTVR
jgi:hypothetical protein